MQHKIHKVKPKKENDIYENETVEALLENDEIDAEEEGFMQGYNEE